MAEKKSISEQDVLKNLEPFAKALQKGAKEIWKIFVMRYVAKGVSQIFLAVVIGGISYMFLYDSYRTVMLLPLAVSAVLIYDAIQLLVNPYYFAMNDVAYRIKNENLLGKK